MFFRRALQRVKIEILNLVYKRNILCSSGKFRPLSGAKLQFHRTAKIILDGMLSFGGGFNGRTSILRMDENARIAVRGDFQIAYGADIVVFPSATLELGNSYINSDCKIRCHQHISIGNGCAISHDFTIMDGNAHSINGSRDPAPIVIEDHVWIATRVTVLPGVHIGKGAVIAAGAVVTRDVPPDSLAAGVPARVVREDIQWEY